MNKAWRYIRWFIRSIFTEGNPGAGPPGTDRAREAAQVDQIINRDR
jgi:hypothetical protein